MSEGEKAEKDLTEMIKSGQNDSHFRYKLKKYQLTNQEIGRGGSGT